MNKRWRSIKRVLEKPWAAYTFAGCCCVVLFLFLSNLNLFWHLLGRIYYYIKPVFIGLVIAYVLDPLVKFLEQHLFQKIRKKKLAKGLSVFLVFAGIILFIVILLLTLVPQLISSIRMFISNLSSYANGMNDMLEELTEFAAEHDVDISEVTSMGNDLIGSLMSTLPKSLNRVLDTTISYGVDIFNLIISCIIAAYLLMDKVRLLAGANRLYRALTSEKSYEISNSFLGRCNSIIIQFILCDLVDGLLIGSINALFMVLAGYPYVPLISVVVGVTNLMPTFGPLLGGATGAVILFLINPWYSLGFIIFTVILQTFDGYVFKPKLFGSLLGVSSIWILAAIIIFGRMFGIVGILMAIPLAAIVDFLYKEAIIPRLEARRSRIDAAKAAAQGLVHAEKKHDAPEADTAKKKHDAPEADTAKKKHDAPEADTADKKTEK